MLKLARKRNYGTGMGDTKVGRRSSAEVKWEILEDRERDGVSLGEKLDGRMSGRGRAGYLAMQQQATEPMYVAVTDWGW